MPKKPRIKQKPKKKVYRKQTIYNSGHNITTHQSKDGSLLIFRENGP